MEKLVYVLWKKADESDGSFAKRLLTETAPRLQEAGARFLKISVVDDDVAAGAGLRIGQMDPAKAGLATFWVHQAQERGELEGLLSDACGDIFGFLVAESRALVPTTEIAKAGERTPGFHLVTCITPQPGLERDAFIGIWHEEFRDIAIETQSTFDYVRNEIIRPLTGNDLGWAAVVEEGFPIGALDDQAVFYDAVGDADRQKANAGRMFESVQKFLDLSKIESHPMSEYVFERMP